jgi:catechol 2,3-dioxygenase-like lactoylglutathione lyase family enzyme
MLHVSRRQILKGLAATAASTILPFPADANPSFKPIWLNQYTYIAPDMKKTVDWYVEVFAMQKGLATAKETHLWFGDLQGDTLMIVKQAQAGDVAPSITRMGFTVNYWDRNTIEAELKKRNLNPQSDTEKGFWFKDPEGNEVGVLAHDWLKRPAAKSSKPFLWKAISANHIVVTSPEYRKLANWYLDLLAFNETTDSGRDVCQWFGDTVWLPTQVSQGKESSGVLKTFDHCALTIDNYDTHSVALELKRRKMIPETSNAETSNSLGINCVDVNNFKSQVCAWNEAPNQDRNRAQRGQGGQRRGGE